MIKFLARIYVVGFFVVGLFLTFSSDMTARESMDIAAKWPVKMYDYIDLYFKSSNADEYAPARK